MNRYDGGGLSGGEDIAGIKIFEIFYEVVFSHGGM